MWLLIDDQRTLNVDVIARTSEAGKMLAALSFWECICLDHDMGEGQEDGYQILKWMIKEGYLPKRIQLVTSNPVGRQNMTNLLLDFGYFQTHGINFIKKRGM